MERSGNFFFNQRLPQAGGLQCPGNEVAQERKLFPDERKDLFVEHRAQLARRAGQHDQPARFVRLARWIRLNFDGQARRGAVRVVKHNRPFRHERLHAGSLRHGAFAQGEKIFDVGKDRGVFAQLFAQQVCNQVACQVIGGWAEASGGDDQVGARQRLAHGLLNYGFVYVMEVLDTAALSFRYRTAKDKSVMARR